jgi:hypothetical protein
MSTQAANKPRRPWWVRLAIPLASAKRRDAWLKLFLVTVPFAVLFGFLATVSFILGASSYPYRWGVVALFVLAVVEIGIEVAAIRWTNQARAWQR